MDKRYLLITPGGKNLAFGATPEEAFAGMSCLKTKHDCAVLVDYKLKRIAPQYGEAINLNWRNDHEWTTMQSILDGSCLIRPTSGYGVMLVTSYANTPWGEVHDAPRLAAFSR